MQYRIDLDFCLDRRAISRENMDKDRARGSPTPQSTTGVFDGAFSFSIPLHVLHADSRDVRDAPLQAEAELDSAHLSDTSMSASDPQAASRVVSSIVSVQLQALRCLESSIVILPIRVQT